MPTYWSQTLIPTLREVPAEAEVPSHQLMLRAGYIRKLGSGMYSYLPLGLRSLHKASAIIREEMATAGAVEVLFPALVPLELYQQTGRDAAYGDNLFRVKDRHGREQALGPTHEEIVTELIGASVGSYKDLPKTLYQIQTKFRDEFRPRFGVLRSREFLMKDAYSFHLDLPSLEETYQKQYDAYCRIFDRCGLAYEIVEAESGPIGGSASHEFMVPSPTGEDTILKSDKGNYAANVEKCAIGPRKVDFNAEPKGALEDIHTPGCAGIDDVCAFFKKNLGSKLATKNMLKTLVYHVEHVSNAALSKPAIEIRQGGLVGKSSEAFFAETVIAVVRGDHEVNEAKLKSVIAQNSSAEFQLGLMDPIAAKAEGYAIGFVGPHLVVSKANVKLIVDPDAAQGGFWVTGANEVDHHVKCFNWKRDVLDRGVTPIVADIRNAVDGDPSPKNDGGILHTTKGIEIGHVFKLGDKYTKTMNVTVLLNDQTRTHPLMGCYGIGVNRILAAAIERQAPKKGHDESGIIWPRAIAPYQVLITPIRFDGPMRDAACGLAGELEKAGVDVLIDDRDERPGVKFKDADLVGIPLRITVGDKGLAEGKIELKARDGSNGPKGELIPVADACARALELLKSL